MAEAYESGPISDERLVDGPVRGDTDEVLDTLLRAGAQRSAALGLDYRRLWGELAAVATTGGKRRPAIFLAAYRACGGADEQAASSVAAAIELLHASFVIHDDVIDEDDVRRGRLNVNGSHTRLASAAGASVASAEGYGRAAGVLAGDLALAAALKTVATCPCPPSTMLALLDLFDEALHVSAAGELGDVYLSLGVAPATVQQSLEMERRKTAAYSFTLPLQAGAVLAGASSAVVDCCGEVGSALGAAYQLVDDLLGVFGDPAVTGKSNLSDLRAGKQTPLLAHARTTSVWADIAPYVGRGELDDAGARHVRCRLVEGGSRDFVTELARDAATRSVRLAQASLPAPLVAVVESAAQDLRARIP